MSRPLHSMIPALDELEAAETAQVTEDTPTRYMNWSLRSFWWHLLLMGMSLALLGLAFPEPGIRWCAFVALVPACWVAVRSVSPLRLLWTSYLLSVIWWLVRIDWLAEVTGGGYLALSLFLAAYFPLSIQLVRWISLRYRVPVSLSLPLAWVSLEWVRGTFPAGGFSWFTLGHSLAPSRPDHDLLWPIQIADVFGDYGVSFLLAMANGAIVDLLALLWSLVRRISFSGRLGLVLMLPVTAGLWGGNWLYGQYRLNETSPYKPRELRVAVVQTNVPQSNKSNPTVSSADADWARIVALSRKAAAEGFESMLIVWPETMVPAGLNADAILQYQKMISRSGMPGGDVYHKKLSLLSRELRAYLLIGAYAYFNWKTSPGPESHEQFLVPTERYNSAFVYGPDGQRFSRWYDKHHRVPFGEYIPWVEKWPWLKEQFVKYLTPVGADYTLYAGKDFTVFEFPAGGGMRPETAEPPDLPKDPTQREKIRVVTPICYEDTVASLCRKMVYTAQGDKRADVLINLTNDGWYAGTDQGPQHLQIAVFRCIENRVPMARSVNTGISAFIDSYGRIGPQVVDDDQRQEVEGFAVRTVITDDRLTIYGMYGNLPVIALAVFTAVVTAAGQGREVEITL